VIDVKKALSNLAKSRPIFHSEADFQHALAWEIQQQQKLCSLRLEFKPAHLDNRIYLDMWITDESHNLAIELKYKTRSAHVNYGGETFDLQSHSAQDISRYDFLKDVQRLEQVVHRMPNITGYAILLTNDSLYWKSPTKPNMIDADFRLYENRIVSGEMTWAKEASFGTTKKREHPIILRGNYSVSWCDYSTIADESCGQFRYLLLRVDK